MMKDEDFLKIALLEAQKGLGHCAPNPAVGAVIVHSEKILAQGYHRAVGTDHAEVDAIKQVSDVKGTTIYVTLEPCCHTGRTPPCTEAIIKAGISRVVFACRDPNRHTAETGEQVLKRAGIRCDFLPISQIEAFYRYYFHWLKTRLPWITTKLAVSFDGKIAGPGGKTVKITGDELEKLTHQKRLHADGILTTVKSTIADDPQLNVRLQDAVIKKPLFILDSHGNLPLTARVFKTAKSITIFHQREASPEKIKNLTDHGVTCVPVDDDDQGLELMAVKRYLGGIGLHQVLMEAGGIASTRFLQAGLSDEFLLYIAPVLLGHDAVRAFSEVMDFESSVKKFTVIAEPLIDKA